MPTHSEHFHFHGGAMRRRTAVVRRYPSWRIPLVLLRRMILQLRYGFTLQPTLKRVPSGAAFRPSEENGKMREILLRVIS